MAYLFVSMLELALVGKWACGDVVVGVGGRVIAKVR